MAADFPWSPSVGSTQRLCSSPDREIFIARSHPSLPRPSPSPPGDVQRTKIVLSGKCLWVWRPLAGNYTRGRLAVNENFLSTKPAGRTLADPAPPGPVHRHTGLPSCPISRTPPPSPCLH